MIKKSNINPTDKLFQNFRDEVDPNLMSEDDDFKLLDEITIKFNLLVYPFIKTCGLKKDEIHFLEIGCGDGKYGLNISQYVKEYSGVDIRKKSLNKAKKTLVGKNNCKLYLNDGKTLNQFPDNSQHLVFSYQVFFHFPEKNIIESYLKEVFRVLNKDGIAKIQLSGPCMRGGLRISWFSIARFNFIWRVFRFLPGNFQIPILRLKAPKIKWGRWGAFYNPLSAIRMIEKLGGRAFTKPCIYGSPYNVNDRELYWLYITKNRNNISEICLG